MIVELVDKFIKEKNLVIRPIPEHVRSVYEASESNIARYNGEVKYLEKYKRNMLVVYEVPAHAGELLVVQCKHTNKEIDYSGGMYFKNLGEMYRYYSKILDEEV